MKVKISVVGDTEAPGFKALQDLIVGEGYPVSITRVLDKGPQVGANFQQTSQAFNAGTKKRKRFRPSGKVNLRMKIRDLLAQNGNKATRRELLSAVKGWGYAPNSEAATVSWLKIKGYATEDQFGMVKLVKKPTDQETRDHRAVDES